MEEQSPTPLPDVTPPGGSVKANLKQALPIRFFECRYADAVEKVRKQRACDWWVLDWPTADYFWLFGSRYSPLANSYYNKIAGEINDAIASAQAQCEADRFAAQQEAKHGVSVAVASRLVGGTRMHGVSADTKVFGAHLSVVFNHAASNPTACPPLPRELFAEPVDFEYVLYGPGNENFRWEIENPQAIQQDPYFEHYGRRLRFEVYDIYEYYGTLKLIIDKVVDLRVRFEARKIPDAVVDRVDPSQPLDYQISQGAGSFWLAIVIEVKHLESGQVWSESILGHGYPPGQLIDYWPSKWNSMSVGEDGFIRHRGFLWLRALGFYAPDDIGLPNVGSYRLRVILLAYGYQTKPRYVLASVPGVSGRKEMSIVPIEFSHMPSLISYTADMTEGIIPPFEVIYERNPVLKSGILMDAVFDIKNLTTFRFVIKVQNTFDFAVGVVVQVGVWHAWVRLRPGETKYLAGATAVSANWAVSPLHPVAQDSCWVREDCSLVINGRLREWFYLYLTAPNAPETFPPNIVEKQAKKQFGADPESHWSQQYDLSWCAIKRYAPDGNYAYVHQNFYDYQMALASIERSTEKPGYQSLIDPATYFPSGYATDTIAGNEWCVSPWPSYIGWGGGRYIAVNAQVFDWRVNDWVTVEKTISLTRAMMLQVAAMLGIAEYAVMDGDDLRWFVPVTYNPPTYLRKFDDILWIDRFYTPNGALVDEAAMRAAFQAVIDANADQWPSYTNIGVHPSVRFGLFLGTSAEPGECQIGPNGNLVEVGSLDDLGSVSTRFLYCIKPDYR